MSEQFASQMNFLHTYYEAFEKRQETIKTCEKELDMLTCQLDRAAQLKATIDDLKKQNRADEKFLISMNDMVMRNTGAPVSQGPLFDNTEKEREENE